MSVLNFVLKFCARQSNCHSYGLNVLFSKRNQFPKVATVYNYNTYYKRINLSLKTSAKSYPKSGNYLSYRHCMARAAVDESKPSTSYYHLLMFDRIKQAQRSILFEVASTGDIAYALAYCEKFGAILKVYSYSEASNNCFLLVEFVAKSAAQQLLLDCKSKNIGDGLSVFSHLVLFQKTLYGDLPKWNIEVNSPVYSVKENASVSDLIESIYFNEKVSELSTRLRYFFCILIKDAISDIYPDCDVLPFGSSVNGIGAHNCDLNIVIRPYPEQLQVNDRGLSFLSKTCGDVESLQGEEIFNLGDLLKTCFPGVSSVQKMIHFNTKMPIAKLKHKMLDMDCNIFINNLSAVAMSEIIHFCGEIDSRVRPLLYVVKRWAEETGITGPGHSITTFGLTMLVLFFLQNRYFPILPPFNNSFVISGENTTTNFGIQYLKCLDELKEDASLNEESLACLFKEFLIYLEMYPFEENILSLMTGKAELFPHCISGKYLHGKAAWVQYPFKEDLNITANVSDNEFKDIRRKVNISLSYFKDSDDAAEFISDLFEM